jgi:undecaprenyl-diphosphatase
MGKEPDIATDNDPIVTAWNRRNKMFKLLSKRNPREIGASIRVPRSMRQLALITVRPTAPDIAIANTIAAHTNPPTEEMAQALTWAADEHILLALAAAWWLNSRGQPARQRKAADHVLLTTLVVSALPHLLKRIFDQPRPDRLTLRGHWRGVPFSGNRLDAFPSGHAIHVGALASAAAPLPARQRNMVWLAGAGLVATRIVLLAHWTSDVIAGLAIGIAVERWLRRFTGYSRENDSGIAASALRTIP